MGRQISEQQESLTSLCQRSLSHAALALHFLSNFYIQESKAAVNNVFLYEKVSEKDWEGFQSTILMSKILEISCVKQLCLPSVWQFFFGFHTSIQLQTKLTLFFLLLRLKPLPNFSFGSRSRKLGQSDVTTEKFPTEPEIELIMLPNQPSCSLIPMFTVSAPSIFWRKLAILDKRWFISVHYRIENAICVSEGQWVN